MSRHTWAAGSILMCPTPRTSHHCGKNGPMKVWAPFRGCLHFHRTKLPSSKVGPRAGFDVNSCVRFMAFTKHWSFKQFSLCHNQQLKSFASFPFVPLTFGTLREGENENVGQISSHHSSLAYCLLVPHAMIRQCPHNRVAMIPAMRAQCTSFTLPPQNPCNDPHNDPQ